MITKLALHSLVVEEIDRVISAGDQLTFEHRGSSEGQLMTESFKQTAVNAVQYVIAGAAEYGIAIGTAGAGLAGPAEAAETIIDIAFASDAIASTVSSLTDTSKLTNEGRQIVDESRSVFPVLPRSLDEFYKSIKGIVARVLSALGDGIAYASEKLKEVIEKLLENLSDSIGDMVKPLIPDATVGLVVASALGIAIGQAAENIYDLIKAALLKAGKYAMWMLNPNNVMSFFDQQYPLVISLCRQASERIDSMGLKQTVASVGLATLAGPAGAGPGAALVRTFGPAGFKKLADTLQQKQASVRKVLQSIVNIAMPFFMTYTAILQILMKGDYEQSLDQQAADVTGKSAKATKAISKGFDAAGGESGIASKAAQLMTKAANIANESRFGTMNLRRIDERIEELETTMSKNFERTRTNMRINESTLRRIIREEIESVERNKKLIVQDIEEQELGGGYSMEYGAIPGATNELDDDFQKIRLARLKASGVPPEKAEKMAGSKLKHRGKKPGRG